MNNNKPRGISIYALLDESGTGSNLSADPRQELHAADFKIGTLDLPRST